MKHTRTSAHYLDYHDDEEGGLFRAWSRFWFAAADPFGLHLVRVCFGLLLLAWLLPLAGSVEAFFGLTGWFDRQAYVEAGRLPLGGMPKPISWSLLYLCGASASALQTMYWASIAVLVLFTLGIATRITAVLSWLVVVSFTATPAFDDELEAFLLMFSFYLALGYLLLGLRDWKLSWTQRILGSWDTLFLGRLFRRPTGGASESIGANLAMRLLQVHFAVLVVTSGLHKLQVGEWWAGLAHWYYLYPPFEATIAKVRAGMSGSQGDAVLMQLNAAAYATIAWQLAFPLFAWRTGWWRLVLVGGTVAGWLGLALIYRMPLIGPAFAIGCLGYLSARDWSFVGSILQRISLHRLGAWLEAQSASAREPAGSLQTTRER